MTIGIGISITSVFIAAFLAHYFATSRMRKNDLSSFQFAAYSDFLGAASRLAVSRRLGDSENEVNDLAKLNDSKNRILICGDRLVVKALVNFWELGATLEKESELLAFKDLSMQIRQSLGHKRHDLFDLEISNILFKLEPSSYSYKGSKERTSLIDME